MHNNMNSESKNELEKIIELVKTVKPFDESDFDDGLNDLESTIADELDSALYDARRQIEQHINQYRSETTNSIHNAAMGSAERDRIIDALESAKNDQQMPAGLAENVVGMVTAFDPDAMDETVDIIPHERGVEIVWNDGNGEMQSITLDGVLTVQKLTAAIIERVKHNARAEGRTAMQTELRKLLNIE